VCGVVTVWCCVDPLCLYTLPTLILGMHKAEVPLHLWLFSMKLSNKPSASLASKKCFLPNLFKKHVLLWTRGSTFTTCSLECCPHTPLTTYPNYLAIFQSHGSFKFIFKYIPEAIDGR
jgi:hypothetical protein